jgi:hypothetical protein
VFLIGWSLMMNNPRYQEVYARKRAEGKNHTTCLLIIGRKFLRFLFSYFWKKNLTILQETPRQAFRLSARKSAQMKSSALDMGPQVGSAVGAQLESMPPKAPSGRGLDASERRGMLVHRGDIHTAMVVKLP